MALRIAEPLPADPTEAEAVLHVRRKLRAIVAGPTVEGKARALALLFGQPEDDAARFRTAATALQPIEAAAAVVAGGGEAALGHDAEHVERCRRWLLDEKAREPAYSRIVAFDLATLLALSRARELATAGATSGRPPVPILVRGDTGTGKELLAQAIHEMSGRRGPLSPVHISGMPPDHVNDELFGHARGAFTGATVDRMGRLEAADGGTILLDEVGDLSPEGAVRLLRVLQDGSLSRLGENRVRPCDIRVIAATWHDLAAEVEQGRFRRDLFHRLCVGEVVLPPLRERRAGFADVVEAMLAQLSWTGGLSPAAMAALELHSWPGNLRELDGVLRMACASRGQGTIQPDDLPFGLQRRWLASAATQPHDDPGARRSGAALRLLQTTNGRCS